MVGLTDVQLHALAGLVAKLGERSSGEFGQRERIGGRTVLNQPAGHVERGETLLQAVVREITGEPGKTLAHIEFTRDGRYALASLWEDEGAVIVEEN